MSQQNQSAPGLSQQNRKIRVDTALGEDVLLLERYKGVEAVSAPYVFTLEMISADPEINPEPLLRSPASITIELTDGTERKIHGLIRRFIQLESNAGLTSYRAELVPWLWFLSLSSDCRVFQRMSAQEIIDKVFQNLGFSDFKWNLAGTPAKREYCVQYRETNLNFVSRLLEEEGIFYFFEHTADAHTLVLADYAGAVKPCPGQKVAKVAASAGPWQHDDVITGLVIERSAHTGRVSLTDFNYLTPNTSLDAQVSGKSKEEIYDYPGRYAERGEGDTLAKVILESHETLGFRINGGGTCRAFQAGYRFELDGHYRRDLDGKEFMLLSVQHAGYSGGFRSDRGEDERDYEGSFTALPYDTPFRPARVARSPMIAGTQTAMVVGPAGEEIWTDEHGRVKIQFHWDRVGKNTDESSCWVRVAQSWAGQKWGGLVIPRVGQEVVVEFMEGDPDRPIIVGCVYNGGFKPPYAPEKGGVVSGLRSQTHKGTGYNEMSMDDTAGKEMITIHAQYDMSTTVEHDETATVHNNRTVTVDVDHTESVGNDQKWDVGNDQTGKVGNNQKLTVGVNQEESIGTDRTVNVGGNDKLDVGQKLAITAGTEITITVGSASITMKADGTIDVSGVNITVDGMKVALLGKAEVSATAVASSMKATPASLELASPMIKSAATAINEITGAMVKLN